MPRLRHLRFFMFLAGFAGFAAVAMPFLPVERSVILGFTIAALGFIGSSVPLWRDNRQDSIRARGAGDDGGRALLLAVSLIVFATVLIALGRMIGGRNELDTLGLVWAAGTLVLAWIFVNLVYAYHYAHLYYVAVRGKPAGGLGFPGDDPPLFADFCYFSFVIGMTCQVSDVSIETRALRRITTLHGILAFFFNLGVLALTINVLAGIL